MLEQLLAHLSANGLLEPFQSAYRKGHSTETALLRVVNDLLQAADKGRVSILTLLDLSAAFDTIDHSTMFRRLELFGCTGLALDWFKSYLTGRTQCVSIGKKCSKVTNLDYGVPQGSVLGPVLFTIYTSTLSTVVSPTGLSYHLFADDTQLYSSASPTELPSLSETMSNCVGNVSDWMSKSKLRMNDEKTEVLVVASSHKLKNASSELLNGLNVSDITIPFSKSVRNLGVFLDGPLSMEDHIKHLCKVLYFQLRRIAKIRHLLSVESANKLCVSLILSKLDYCNSLLYGVSDKHLAKLQRIQNSAARLVLRRDKHSSASELLKTLHWLPIKARIEYKLSTICFKCLSSDSNGAPAYLSSLLNPYIPSRSLRSQNAQLLSLPRFNLKSCGYKSFTVSGPTIWNSLPISLRKTESLSTFKRHLKTHLFTKYLS